MLDVPALQHAACGGVLMMVKHLRLAEVHSMSSLEHMLCQSDTQTKISSKVKERSPHLIYTV